MGPSLFSNFSYFIVCVYVCTSRAFFSINCILDYLIILRHSFIFICDLNFASSGIDVFQRKACFHPL